MDQGEISIVDSTCVVGRDGQTDKTDEFAEINDLIASVVSEAVNGGLTEADIQFQLNAQAGDQAVEEGQLVIEEVDHEAEESFERSCNEIEAVRGEYFIVTTLQEMQKLIDNYFESTKTHFVLHKRTKHFGLQGTSPDVVNHRINWTDISIANENDKAQQVLVNFDGVPHTVPGHYQLNCHFGFDPSVSAKERRKKLKEDEPPDSNQQQKCVCPCKIVVKHVIRYPEYKAEGELSKSDKVKLGNKLKEALRESPETVASETMFLIRFPDDSEHQFHDHIQEGGSLKEEVHRDLIIKAQDLCLKGHKIAEILAALQDHVTNYMFYGQQPPDLQRRRYYPTHKDINSFIIRVCRFCHLSSDEQLRLQNIVEEVKFRGPNYRCEFRVEERPWDRGSFRDNGKAKSEERVKKGRKRSGKLDDSDHEGSDTGVGGEKTKGKRGRRSTRKVHPYVFCTQSSCQRRLLRMYGNVVYLSELSHDALVKNAITCKCYVLLVQTNVDYQVVGLVLMSKLRVDGLAEGLTLMREWNSFWNPKYVFVDCSDVMFNTISNVFPDACQLLNLHSCEEKWAEFVSTPPNDVATHEEEILGYLRAMQYSLTEESLTHAAGLFESSDVWRCNSKLKKWFQEKWLVLAKLWVFGYRPEDLIVMHHLNISLVECMTVYKHAYTRTVRPGDGLPEFLNHVTKTLQQQEYEKYKKRNVDQYSFYSGFSLELVPLPDSLQGVPITLLPYVYQMYKLQNKSELDIEEDEELGVFTVTCRANDELEGVNNEQEVQVAKQQPVLEHDEYAGNDLVINEAFLEDDLKKSDACDQGDEGTVDISAEDSSRGKTTSKTGESGKELVSKDFTDNTLVMQDTEYGMMIVDGEEETEEAALDNDLSNQIHNNHPEESNDSTDTIEFDNEAALNECMAEKNKESEDVAIQLYETDFSVIRYLGEAEAGSFTVSFGDATMHPFCTCSYWSTYKFPCIHMCSVFCKIPGWRYSMLSALYRCNPVLEVDLSCVSWLAKMRKTVDKGCQVWTSKVVASKSTQVAGYQAKRSSGVQVDISETSAVNLFERPKNIGVSEMLMQRAKEFQQHVSRASILFKDKSYRSKLLDGLQIFLTEAQIELDMRRAISSDSTAALVNGGNGLIRQAGQLLVPKPAKKDTQGKTNSYDSTGVAVVIYPKTAACSTLAGTITSVQASPSVLDGLPVSSDPIAPLAELKTLCESNTSLKDKFCPKSVEDILTLAHTNPDSEIQIELPTRTSEASTSIESNSPTLVPTTTQSFIKTQRDASPPLPTISKSKTCTLSQSKPPTVGPLISAGLVVPKMEPNDGTENEEETLKFTWSKTPPLKRQYSSEKSLSCINGVKKLNMVEKRVKSTAPLQSSREKTRVASLKSDPCFSKKRKIEVVRRLVGKPRPKRPKLSEKRPSLSERRPSLSEKRPSLSERRPPLSEKRPLFSERRSRLNEKKTKLTKRKPKPKLRTLSMTKFPQSTKIFDFCSSDESEVEFNPGKNPNAMDSVKKRYENNLIKIIPLTVKLTDINKGKCGKKLRPILPASTPSIVLEPMSQALTKILSLPPCSDGDSQYTSRKLYNLRKADEELDMEDDKLLSMLKIEKLKRTQAVNSCQDVNCSDVESVLSKTLSGLKEVNIDVLTEASLPDVG